MSKTNQESFIYLSEKDFSKYFPAIVDNPKYKDALEIFKEGELYKIQTNEKTKNILAEIACTNRVTIDDAFLLLMKASTKLNEEREKLKQAAVIYKQASNLKKTGKLKDASQQYFTAIELCLNKPYMRKMKGGAYFHLADIAKILKDEQAYKTYLKLCLQFYPEHKLAQKYASNN